MSGENDPEILFSGGLPIDSTTQDEAGTSRTAEDVAPEIRPSGPPWWQAMEQAFFHLTSTEENRRLYGDPQKGATIEQAWRTRILISGRPPVCLVAEDRPPVSTRMITRVHGLTADALVQALQQMLASGSSKESQVFYHDGSRGHSITILGYDTGNRTFTFMDPWPGRSLLCAENNPAGIDARPSPTQPKLWTITADELQRVIVVAFVEPAMWVNHTGDRFRLTYDGLRSSEFWTFFHITEQSRHPAEGGRTGVQLLPGGFPEHLFIRIELDDDDVVLHAQAGLRRSWMIGPPYGVNPFALDFACSYLATCVPAVDREQVQPLVDALRRLGDPEAVAALPRDAETWNVAGELLMTYMGGKDRYSRMFEYSSMDVRNITDVGDPWMLVIVDPH
jgi:hypothetical protein